MPRGRLAQFLLWFSLLPLTAQPAFAAVLEVNACGYGEDDGVCDSSHCSMTEALNESNENGEPDTIRCNIAGPCVDDQGVATLTREAGTPDDLSEGMTTLDCCTQPGASTDAPKVNLDGSALAEPHHGISISSSGNTVRCLCIHGFSTHGILLSSLDPADVINGNIVEYNVIGSDCSRQSTAGNAINGVRLYDPSGGTMHISTNIIRNNYIAYSGDAGITIVGDDNLVLDNMIVSNRGGIVIGDGTTGAQRTTLKRNVILTTGESHPIEITGVTDNAGIQPPTLLAASSERVVGETMLAGSGFVELFDADTGEFLLEVADDDPPNFLITPNTSILEGIPLNAIFPASVKATVTDSDGNTSAFSEPVAFTGGGCSCRLVADTTVPAGRPFPLTLVVLLSAAVLAASRLFRLGMRIILFICR